MAVTLTRSENAGLDTTSQCNEATFMTSGSEMNEIQVPDGGSLDAALATTESHVLVYGMFGAGNAGDEALCLAVVEGVRRALSDPVIYVMSQDRDLTAEYAGISDVTWLRGGSFSHRFWTGMGELWQTLSKVDVVIVGGGGLLQDQFSWLLPAASGFVAGLARIRGIPTLILGVGVGPIRRRWLRATLRLILPHLACVNVRDQDSYDATRGLGVNPGKLSQTADLALTLPVNRAVVPSYPGNRGTNVGIALRPWAALDLDAAAALVSALAEFGYGVRLLCFSKEGDFPLYQSVLERSTDSARSKTTVVVPETLQELWHEMADLRCILSMRLHGCVFSLCLNTPLLPIQGERKVAAFASQVGLSEWLVTLPEIGPELVDQVRAVERFWQNEETEVVRRSHELADRTARSFDLIPRALLAPPPESPPSWSVLVGTGALFLAGFLHEVGRAITWPIRLLRRQRSFDECR